MPDRIPPAPMDGWDDPELAALFAGDPDLYELSRSLRASRPQPVAGRHFEPYLRARLMDAAVHELRPRGLSRWLRPRPGLLAGGGAALGVAMIAAVVVATVAHQSGDSRVDMVATNVAENHQVNPDEVITVAFSQAVDHTSVERNLQIRPATAVQTRWEGNTLVITPVHHLAANTPYSVTIPHEAVRSQSGGQVARADIHITFGTRSTPSPGPTQQPVVTPTLSPLPLGPVSPDTQLLFGPDGSVVATHGLVAAPPSASPSPTATGTTGVLPTLPATTPTLRGVPLPVPATSSASTSTPSPGASATAHLVHLAGDGSGSTTLGPASSAAAFSPSGASLSYLVRRTSTQADLWVASGDGSHAVRLVRNADLGSPLAWSGEDGVVYLSGGQVTSVDLQGRSRPVGGSLRVAPGQDVALAPGGQVVYVGPAPTSAQGSPSPSGSATATPTPTPSPSASASASASGSGSPSASPLPDSAGRIVVLASGATQPLRGIAGMPAFSGDGARVAWVDASGSAPLLVWMATAGDPTLTPTVISTPAAKGDSISTLALSGDGSRAAYTLTHDGAGPAFRVVTVASSVTAALGDGPVSAPVFSAHGDRLAFVRSAADGTAQAEAATVPGAGASATPGPDAVPGDAAGVLDRFVAAQLLRDPGTMHSLSAAALSLAPSLTPDHVTRSYVIKSTMDPATGTVTAQVRLVRDASQTQGVAYADELVTLARDAASQAFQVTAVTLDDFRVEPVGPQIVHVGSERQQSALVLRLAFDSDLDPASVTTAAISLTSAKGAAVPLQVSYEVESRTVVVRIADAPSDALTLMVTGDLRDIAGQPLSSTYSTTLQG